MSKALNKMVVGLLAMASLVFVAGCDQDQKAKSEKKDIFQEPYTEKVPRMVEAVEAAKKKEQK